VNQPFVFGWHRDAMYVQAFPVLEDDEREHPKAAETLLNAGIDEQMWQKLKQHNVAVDLELVNELVAKPRGIAMPVSRRDTTLDSYLAAARHVENRVPPGATWNGSDEVLTLAEEFEAQRSGKPMPKKAPPKVKKTAAKPAGPASGS
jgi:L,D-transpeptidase ErfK/SrfK